MYKMPIRQTLVTLLIGASAVAHAGTVNSVALGAATAANSDALEASLTALPMDIVTGTHAQSHVAALPGTALGLSAGAQMALWDFIEQIHAQQVGRPFEVTNASLASITAAHAPIVSSVPLPASSGLFAAGLLGLVAWRKKFGRVRSDSAAASRGAMHFA